MEKYNLLLFCTGIFRGDIISTKVGIKDLKQLTEKMKKFKHTKTNIDGLSFAIFRSVNIKQELEVVSSLISIRKQLNKNRYIIFRNIHAIICGEFELHLDEE